MDPFGILPEGKDPTKISSEQWDTFKSLLKQKYVYEGMTLDKVKEYMSDAHQFQAR
jgi:hypothetical protein